MAREYPKIDPALHQKVLQEEILRDPDLFLNATSVDRPRAIITAGQPGAGKSKVVGRLEADLDGNVVTVDPDELRKLHPQVDNLRRQHPYTWSGHTHGDASQWATELRQAAVAQRKNIILDTTMPRTDLIKELQAQGYDVEIRAIATHRLESELGVANRFSRDVDKFGHGRHVPEGVRKSVYNRLPDALDDVARQTGVPIRIYDREGRLHFDSRSAPNASPGRALKAARFSRLTQSRLDDLHQSSGAQRLHNEVGGYRAARSSCEQWVRGGEEAANQTVRTEVTGLAATVGAIPGEASAAFDQGAERNSRFFEARAEINQTWEQSHAKYPQIEKDDVNDALARLSTPESHPPTRCAGPSVTRCTSGTRAACLTNRRRTTVRWATRNWHRSTGNT
ncbi:MAG: zeta toxin family protein [Burkholderiaceae bacterium]